MRIIVNNKKGFTLAEVLITLGVIGVVAALTLPTVIQNYKKQEMVNKLKKVYSEFSQSIELSKANYGEITSWDWDLSAEKFFKKYLISNLKIAKDCNKAQGCWESNRRINWLNGGYQSIENHAYTILLSDGVGVKISKQDNKHIHVAVDLNGPKVPNMYGKDIFSFTATKNAFNDGYHSVSTGGFYFWGQGIPLENIPAQYACNKTGSGTACGYKIFYNGWKIPDDYPWN